MLKKKEIISHNNVDTIIGKNAFFEGTYKSSGLLRVDGKFNGEMYIDGDIIIGKDGVIKGSIKARNIEISGHVEGDITSSELVKICPSGKLIGDIEVGSFVIEENGVFDGKCKMKNDEVLVLEDSIEAI